MVLIRAPTTALYAEDVRIVVATTITLTCQHAHADSPSPEPPDESIVTSYRGSTLAADGVALGVFAGGVATGSGRLALIGASLYVIGAPLVHTTNRRHGRAALSVAMRVGLPLLGFSIADSLPRDCGPTGDCTSAPVGIYVGLGVGVVVASMLDAIVLAKADARSQRQASWAPVGGPTRGGFALGVTGQF